MPMRHEYCSIRRSRNWTILNGQSGTRTLVILNLFQDPIALYIRSRTKFGMTIRTLENNVLTWDNSCADMRPVMSS